MELAIYEVFREAGIEEKQAKAIASTLNNAIAQSANSKQADVEKAIEHHYAVHSQNLATQGDVEKVRAETAHVRLEVEKVRLETKADIEKVRAEIEKSKNDIIRWLIGTTLGGIAAALALARLFLT